MDKAGVLAVNQAYFIKANGPYATGRDLLAISKFEYNASGVKKRSGSYLAIPGGYDYNSYTDQVYDTVIYKGPQKLLLQSKNNLGSGVKNPNYWEFDIDQERPLKRISFVYSGGSYFAADTAMYFYDGNKRIQKIEHHNTVQGNSYLYTKTFYFNNGNLERIDGVYLQQPNTIFYSTEERFSAYDQTSNPLKDLWLWDDLFYRSLSVNNFANYVYTRHDDKGNLLDSTNSTVLLHYKADGSISYD